MPAVRLTFAVQSASFQRCPKRECELAFGAIFLARNSRYLASSSRTEPSGLQRSDAWKR